MTLTFPEIVSELGAAIGLIPLIAVLEQVAIAKAFGMNDLLTCWKASIRISRRYSERETHGCNSRNDRTWRWQFPWFFFWFDADYCFVRTQFRAISQRR